MTVTSRIKTAILAAALAGSGAAVVAAPPALAAAEPTTTATAVCDAATATYTVTWTITNATETPVAITSVSVTPGAPISALTGIAVGDLLPPASEGPITATAKGHSYLDRLAALAFRIEGGSTTYGGSRLLGVCGDPVMPKVSSSSRCDELEISVAMPAGGYALPLTISPNPGNSFPTLVVEPGAPARKWTLPKPAGPVDVLIRDVGRIATADWVLPRSCAAPSLGLFRLFAQANYHYVTPSVLPRPAEFELARAQDVDPKNTNGDFDFLDAGGGDIAIRQPANDTMLSLAAEGAPLQWEPHEFVGDPQRFRLVTNSDGTVSLRAKLNGKYVTAEKGGEAPLYANRTAVGPWEKFNRYAGGTGPGPILAKANNGYVTAESAGKKPLIASRGVIGHWEYFSVQDLGNGNVALKSLVNGKYVTAEKAGAQPLIANRAAVGPWETFKLVRNADGTQSLRAQANGRYVTAESAGKKPLIANRAAIGPWEKFDIYAL